MSRVPAIYDDPSWGDTKRAFRSPTLGLDDAIASVTANDSDAAMPADIHSLIDRMERWRLDMVDGFEALPKRRLSRRLAMAGRLVGAGLHLRADLDTSAVTAWLGDDSTPRSQSEAFLARRRLFTERLGDLALLGSQVFQAAAFALPSEVGNRAWRQNAKKLAQLMGGRRLGRFELGLVGVVIGLGFIALGERQLLRAGLGRQLRSSTLLGWGNRRQVDAVNRRARKQSTSSTTRLDYSRGEHLRAAYRVLAEAGVKRRNAHHLIDEALRLGDATSGKPWRGLIQLRELVVHANLDPASTDFIDELRGALTNPLHYSHTPGREWLVRDYTLARELLKADGKTCRTTDSVAVTQAGASIVPGVLASNPAMLGLAAHYMKPIQVYLNGMVAKSGTEHRRHKNVFQDFFRKGEVLDRVEFIEHTVADILDDVEAKAAANDGRFDFKTDLAFNFPIRIICDFMGIPPERAADVQHWSEASVRALDASAGLSLEHLTEGNRSAAAFLDYLNDLVTQARAGEPIPGIIGAVAATDQLNDVELASNLAGTTFAGFETTTALLSLGFLELLQHRDQWEHLRSCLVTGDEVSVADEVVADRDLRWYLWAHGERKGRLTDPGHIERYHLLSAKLARSEPLAERLEQITVQEQALGAAVEEMLRWTAPGSVIPLTLEEDFVLDSPIDTSVGGCPVTTGETITFSKGQTITIDVAGANRSGCPFGPGRFETTPGDFDISRTDNTKHLSFGVTHICMGADLAVENAKRMIEAILRRMGDLELDGLPDEADGNLFIGLEHLPVRSAGLAPRRGARSPRP